MSRPDTETAQSYYEHTRNRTIETRVLEGEVRADVVVVGGGITGCSTALHLAEKGVDVVLVESRHIGWGASGRSGGQIINGLGCEPEDMEQLVGIDTARELWKHSVNAVTYTRNLVDRHSIDCDLTMGYLYLADSPTKARELEHMAPYMSKTYGYDELTHYGKSELGAQIDSQLYHGGVFDPGSGHLHPLNYCLGLGHAAIQAGARVHEYTPVQRVEDQLHRKVVHCGKGTVSCDQVVFACNAYQDGLVKELDRKVMPVGGYVVATEPLGKERADALIPSRSAVCDTNFVLDYYRLSADHRMLFGGRVSYSTLEPLKTSESLRKRMLRVFPQLDDVKVAFSWGGYIAITQNRAPHAGQLDDGNWFSHGYSGHGMALTGYMGKLLAEGINGDRSGIECFERVSHRSFPGGRLMRTPILVAAMGWFRLRDMLR